MNCRKRLAFTNYISKERAKRVLTETGAGFIMEVNKENPQSGSSSHGNDVKRAGGWWKPVHTPVANGSVRSRWNFLSIPRRDSRVKGRI